MSKSSRSGIVLPVVSLLAVFAAGAHAQDAEHKGNPPPHGAPGAKAPAARTVAPRAAGGPAAAAAHVGGPGANPRMHGGPGPMPARSFAGHAYRGHMAWEGGRWRHEVHNGRPGWWWDVGGVWYWYPERLDGPPGYVSEEFADDIAYDAPAAAYASPPGAYAPPPPDPGASAIGGAIVGGVLGGLLTGHASGAAAGAVIGGATGAIAGATAASRPGYWMADGVCYYRYPSGQYVQADPRWCY
jgi:hypothetical protein